MAADSTMLRIVNLLMALSLGVHREQLEQRMGLTWPRPFLLRPLYRGTRRSATLFPVHDFLSHPELISKSIGDTTETGQNKGRNGSYVTYLADRFFTMIMAVV